MGSLQLRNPAVTQSNSLPLRPMLKNSNVPLAMMYDHCSRLRHLLIVAAVIIVPFWQIFSKAGYSGWLSLLMLLPFINLIALFVLAFSDWPALRKKAAPLT